MKCKELKEIIPYIFTPERLKSFEVATLPPILLDALENYANDLPFVTGVMRTRCHVKDGFSDELSITWRQNGREDCCGIFSTETIW